MNGPTIKPLNTGRMIRKGISAGKIPMIRARPRFHETFARNYIARNVRKIKVSPPRFSYGR